MSLTPEQAAKNLAFFVYGGAKLNEEIYGLSSDELWAQLDPAYQADVLLLVNKWWGRMPKVVKKSVTPADVAVGFVEYTYTRVQVDLLWQCLQQHPTSLWAALSVFNEVEKLDLNTLFEAWLSLAEKLRTFASVEAYWNSFAAASLFQVDLERAREDILDAQKEHAEKLKLVK